MVNGPPPDIMSGAGFASLLLTQNLYRYLVLHGVINRDVALELIDFAARQAETAQIQGNTSAESLCQSARFHIEATHIAVRQMPRGPDPASS